MKVERVSYDVITPSAARGILEAIHWKPAIRWVIDEIQVMQPIAFSNIRRNEVSSIMKSPGPLMKTVSEKGSAEPFYQNTQKDRQQRATLMLKNVEYIIKAHFEMTKKAGDDDTEEKHYNIFLRRARKGQCHHQPYFGCREFPVSFELVEEPLSKTPIDEDRDLGWMLYDINFSDDMTPKFFRAQMHKGIITIPESFHKEVNV
jgi:CRISPR-associated protein Cas5d